MFSLRLHFEKTGLFFLERGRIKKLFSGCPYNNFLEAKFEELIHRQTKL